MQLILLLFVLAFCVTVVVKLFMAIRRTVPSVQRRVEQPSAPLQPVEVKSRAISSESSGRASPSYSPANNILKFVIIIVMSMALLIGGLVLLGISVAVVGAIVLRTAFVLIPALLVFFLGYGIYVLLRPASKHR